MIQPRPYTRLRDFQPVPSEIRKDVERYQHWLVSLEKRRETTREEASLPLHLEERHSAKKTLTRSQALFLVGFLLSSGIASFFLRLETITIALGLVTTLYLVQLSLHAFVVLRELAREGQSDTRDPRILDALRTAPWPLYTILCPLYREEQVVPQFIRAMQALDYPPERLQVLLLTEEEDEGTRSAIRSLGHLPSSFEMVTVPHGFPRTKPRACNYGLTRARGKYVVIYDAEDIPEPAQIKKAVLAFAEGGPKLACAQAKLNFYNPNQNILTRLFTIEYSLWFDLVLPAFARARYALPLGGTSNHFQTGILRALGGWDAYNVTEDCDLGMRVNQYGFETGMLASTTYEEANSSLGNWIRQRSRWIKGFCQTYLVHMRHPLQSITKKRGRTLRSLQSVVGASTAVFFLNPLMWLFLVVYMAFRPSVEDTYHIFFPAPVLYGGMLCLIFGNFFYLYIAMLTCAKREQYNLVPWCFLLPVYWLLMSIAGIKGLFQLITRPHYWEKTRHGLHLGKGSQVDMVEAVRITSGHLADRDTIRMAAVQIAQIPTTARVKAIATLPVPIVKEKRTTRKKERDYWLWATVALTCTVSIIATWYSFQHHDILLYDDAYSHMRIARSVIDSLTPGLGQLGNSWLPLPHLIMLPFLWNDYLYQTGLAGSIPSMICYIIASLFVFLTARKLTKKSFASFAGTLVFILNPNVFYLQTTPMSESACFATFAIAGFYFITWVQENNWKYLCLASSSVFLASLTRYDGWVLFLSTFVLIAIIGFTRQQPWQKIESNLILFGSLGSIGILLWLLWNRIIFGSFFSFASGAYSSHAQMENGYPTQLAVISHNLLQSLYYYGLTCLDILGPVIILLGIIGVALFFFKRKPQPEALATLSFLTPVVFYVYSFYSGQVLSLVPSISSHIFNARFGTETVIPTALFISTLMSENHKLPKFLMAKALPTFICFIVLSQSFFIANNGIITLQEGQFGDPCVSQQSINIYLAQHYNSGMILEDVYLLYPNESQEVGIPLSKIIYSGSQHFWTDALKNPGIVDWVIIGARSANSLYPVHVNIKSSQFLSQFRLVLSSKTSDLYVRRNLTLPTHPIPISLLTEHPYCATDKRPPKGGW